jgi:hypothetical protein
MREAETLTAAAEGGTARAADLAREGAGAAGLVPCPGGRQIG